MKITAVEGKLSQFYNHFKDHKFEFCEATDTRLMGVIAMRICWRDRLNPLAKLYQIIHLDYSEYGVDDYFEFDCTPNATTYQENHDAMKYHWDSFISVMGGKIVRLTAREMLYLIEEAIPIASNNSPRSYDDEENVEFRRNALLRLELMREALHEDNSLQLIELNDASFDNSSYKVQEYNAIMAKVIPAQLSACEVINYFLMRLVDRDFKAAAYLSTISAEELQTNTLASPGIQSLIRNTIKKNTEAGSATSHSYNCSMLTEGPVKYYYASFVIYLDGDYTKKNSRIVDLRIGSYNEVSDFEVALHHNQREYITVFDCRDRMLDHFDGDRIDIMRGMLPHQVPNGWLYTIYNKDNSHVNSADYRISDDVYGYVHLSIDGELILMSNKLYNINNIEESVMISMYRPFLRLDNRYTMPESVFQTLINSYGVTFRQLIDHIEL